VLRRAEARSTSEIVRTGDVEIDVTRRRVTVGDRPVDLTATEFELVTLMAREPGRVFTRSQLMEALRGFSDESYDRAVDSHIKNLRRKLEDDARDPHHILTVHGVGYRFADA
jgi:DNA-binding response OmpR family regulator